MKREEHDLIRQEELIQTKKRVFKCLKCLKYARSPVLTQCGHIYCWQCLFKSTLTMPKCPKCRKEIKTSECYPIYTDHHEEKQVRDQPQNQQPNSQNQLSSQQIQNQSLPPRPLAKHTNKILNPNMIGSGLPIASNSLPSNLNMGKFLVGHVYLSSLGVNAFSSIEDGQYQDEDYSQGQKFRLKMHVIIIIAILVIVYFLIN